MSVNQMNLRRQQRTAVRATHSPYRRVCWRCTASMALGLRAQLGGRPVMKKSGWLLISMQRKTQSTTTAVELTRHYRTWQDTPTVRVWRAACFQPCMAAVRSSSTAGGATHASARQTSMASVLQGGGASQNAAGGPGCRASHPRSPSEPPPLTVAERLGVLGFRGLKKLCGGT